MIKVTKDLQKASYRLLISKLAHLYDLVYQYDKYDDIITIKDSECEEIDEGVISIKAVNGMILHANTTDSMLEFLNDYADYKKYVIESLKYKYEVNLSLFKNSYDAIFYIDDDHLDLRVGDPDLYDELISTKYFTIKQMLDIEDTYDVPIIDSKVFKLTRVDTD